MDMLTQPSIPTSRRPSLWRALFHALILLGLLIGLSAVVSALGLVGDVLGRLLIPISFLTFGVSYLLQEGRSQEKSTGRRIVAGLAIGMAVRFMATAAPERGRQITEQEAQPLITIEQDGRKLLKHPYLGFTLHHPGPSFRELSPEELGEVKGAGGGEELKPLVYGFTDPEQGVVLILSLAKGRVSRAEMEGFPRRFATLFQAAVIEEQSVEWSDIEREAFVRGSSEEMRFSARARAVELGPEAEPFLMVVGALGHAPEALDPILGSLRIP
jgi:hypothetical protein